MQYQWINSNNKENIRIIRLYIAIQNIELKCVLEWIARCLQLYEWLFDFDILGVKSWLQTFQHCYIKHTHIFPSLGNTRTSKTIECRQCPHEKHTENVFHTCLTQEWSLTSNFPCLLPWLTWGVVTHWSLFLFVPFLSITHLATWRGVPNVACQF